MDEAKLKSHACCMRCFHPIINGRTYFYIDVWQAVSAKRLSSLKIPVEKAIVGREGLVSYYRVSASVQ